VEFAIISTRNNEEIDVGNRRYLWEKLAAKCKIRERAWFAEPTSFRGAREPQESTPTNPKSVPPSDIADRVVAHEMNCLLVTKSYDVSASPSEL
jgi:hypothetical protein